MKQRALFFIVLLCAGLARATPVTVPNSGFEQPVLAAGGWTNALTSWTGTNGNNNAAAFTEYITAFSSDGTQHLGMELGYDIWQDLTGTTYQANTLYTLTVGIGNRAGSTDANNSSVYSLADTTGVVAATGAANASTSTGAGTFVNAPVITLDTYADPCTAGKTIRVLLQARGAGGRSHFDNIRLDASASVPAGRPAATLNAATAVTSSTATLNGTITAQGSAAPSVVFYYDTADKGGNPASWAGSVTVPGTQTGAFSANVSALQPNTTYFVRARATNASGAVWAAPCLSFTTTIGPPAVDNIPATSISGSSATVGANVTATGGEAPNVTIYYGTTNGGTTAGAWASSVSIPALTGSATRPLSGLTPGTPYYFRAFAQNSGGSAWAPASASFTTTAVTPPTVENRAADNITGTSAEIRGEVTNDGGAAPVITVYWGPADGGSTPGAWANSRVLGPDSGDFGTLVQGLSQFTTYYYTARAVNSAGTAWASPSRSFTTGSALPNSVIINEINYDPADVTKREEFIEFHNPTASSIDMGGWRIDQGVDFVFPAGTIIPAGGYKVVVENTAAFTAAYPSAPAPVGAWQTGDQLSNSGEEIRLRDQAGNTMDTVDCRAGFPWPTAAKGGGQSIELLHPSLTNDVGGNWRAVNSADTVLIPRGSTGWRYRQTPSEPPATPFTWKQFSFDDTGAEWATGGLPAGFIGATPFTPAVTFATTLSFGNTADRTRAYYFRKKFTLASPVAMTLNIRRDDGAVVWINDDPTPTIISADGTWNAPFPYTSLAPNATVTGTYFNYTIPASKFVAGDNIIALQVHQSSTTSSDLLLDLDLSIGGQRAGSPGAANNVRTATVSAAPPAIRGVEHTPNLPATGQNVVVSATITDPDTVGAVSLAWQVVSPGNYIRLQDAAYNNPANWVTVAMNDAGTGGDAVAGDGVFSATVPGAVQQHRSLIRYRITAADALSNSVTVPYIDDEQPNFAYFCYNGVPAWSGSFRPTSHNGFPVTPAVNFPVSVLRSIEPYHLIALDADIAACVWTNVAGTNPLYQGTLIYEGKVYDHIQFNRRGIGSTIVSGKNKLAFKFNRARDFVAKDNWGREYSSDWNSFGLDANASPWAALHRGSAGVEDAASYRVFELGGMPSLRTHYVHLRVIRKAQEFAAAGSSVSDPTLGGTVDGQYTSDLWGLYLALEPTEGNLLDERGLPDGNIYAIEGNGGDKKHQAANQVSNGTDWTTYRDARVVAGQTEAWYRTNMDLPNLYTYLGLSRLVGNVDVRDGDNYRYYHRSSDNRWVIMGYDHDMQFIAASHWVSQTLVDGVRSSGMPHSFAGIMRHPAIALEYRNRCRELLSLMASDASSSGGQIGQLLDEYSQMINPVGQPLTWADVDASMWNLHPRSQGTLGTNSGQTNHRGNFYRSVFTDARGAGGSSIASTYPRNLADPDGDGFSDHESIIQWFKDYATNTYPLPGAGVVPWVRRPTNAGPNAGGGGGDTYVHRQKGYGYKYLEWESLHGGYFEFSTNPPTGAGIGDLTPPVTTPVVRVAGIDRYYAGDTLAALSSGNYVQYPDKPVITSTGTPGYPVNDILLHSSNYRDPQNDNITAVQFRVGEISAPGIPLYDSTRPRIYEIEELWRSAEIATASPTNIADVRVPGSALRAGHTYRARVRHKDSTGRWSFWSNPIEFTTTAPDVSAYANALRITEINYNPGPVTPAESSAPGWNALWNEQEFEFIELRNISAAAVDLTDLRFTKGINFDFLPGTSLAAGAHAVLAKNPVAFAIRYPGVTIAGSYGTDNLANGGEEIKLSYGGGVAIIEFPFDDSAPWPTTPDGGGPTLVLINPAKPLLDHGDPAEWRASTQLNGSPGSSEPAGGYDAWAVGYPGIGGRDADDDKDGFNNRLEYALAGHPLSAVPNRTPAAQFAAISGQTYATLTFTRRAQADDATFAVQFSNELMTWAIGSVLVSSTNNGDGTLTQVWRSADPVSTRSRLFGRVLVTTTP